MACVFLLLFNCQTTEMLGMRLCVMHNLYYYNNMMEEIREALEEGSFSEYKKRTLAGMGML